MFGSRKLRKDGTSASVRVILKKNSLIQMIQKRSIQRKIAKISAANVSSQLLDKHKKNQLPC